MASILLKSLMLVIVIWLCMFVCLTTALPSKKDSYGSSSRKVASTTTTTTKTPLTMCETTCPDEYTPICANEKGSSEKAKSFGNICVMEKYNCEHSTHLEKESDGECKNGSGVRLA